MKLSIRMLLLLAGIFAFASQPSLAASAKNKSNTTQNRVVKANKKTADTKAAKKSNHTKLHYGVKGAKLQPSKVSNKTYAYVEKGKLHQTIDKESSRQYGQEGGASYYASQFHGKRTASGEVYNENFYTAAHKTLAIGSYALVTNLKNGRKVIVKINDRGPFGHNRIIDLSKAAAQEVGLVSAGIGKVRVEALYVDSHGYISGKGAQTLYQLAKREGLPLKIKQNQSELAFKADEQKQSQ